MMLEFYTSVHKHLLKNLAFAGIVICFFTGMTVAFVEFQRIDSYVAGIAIKESQKLADLYIDYNTNPTQTSLARLQQAIRNSLDHDLFISIEFLDQNIVKITSETLQFSVHQSGTLINKFAPFKMTGEVEHQIIMDEGQIYIRIMVPIHDRTQLDVVGHFQGIYHLHDDKLITIKRQGYYAIMMALLVVIFTTVFIYPVVYKLYKKLIIRSSEVVTANTDILKSLGSAIAQRDSDTSAHNYRVTYNSVKLAEKLGKKPSLIRSLIKGAFLHDVGKIGISDSILLKPDQLTPEEFEIMKKHVVIGADIILNINWLQDALEIISFHHERYDGTGYLFGLKENKIPEVARMFAIADVFDALLTHRPYKEPFTFAKTMSILKAGSGTHFDPVFLKAFEQIAPTLYADIYVGENEGRQNDQLNQVMKKYFTLDL
ncbi:MAG: HD-GYP domain-containing protein (c-di-GMP phosphodiesterase class II) [Desulforhopalus sp.]|jgi:HD-GYP domain-containing protein (c-di-GMP phosphodiesterase class II)